MHNLQDQHLRIARIQGRIDQALTAGTGLPAGGIGELRNNLVLAQENVTVLQALIDEDDVAAETERRLAENMTDWARRA